MRSAGPPVACAGAPRWCADVTVNWDDFRLFLIVARAGAFRAAARQLSVDHAVISRRMAQLEETLGTRLFHRRPRGLVLTGAGKELIEAAEAMEANALGVSRSLTSRDQQLEGWVRVSVNVNLGVRVLMPLLEDFTQAHPGIELEVRLTQTVADLAANEADVAVRVAVKPPEDFIARRLAGFAIAAYSAVDEPTHWLGWDPEGPYARFLEHSDWVDLPIRHGLAEDVMVVEALRHGSGAAVLPCVLGDSEPALHRITEARDVASTFALRHPDHRSTPRIRALVDFLAESFGRVADLVEGRRG